MNEPYASVDFRFVKESGWENSMPRLADVRWLPRVGELVDLRAFFERPAHPAEHAYGVVTAVVHLVCGSRGGYYNEREGDVEEQPGAQFVTVLLTPVDSPFFGPPPDHYGEPAPERDTPGRFSADDRGDEI